MKKLFVLSAMFAVFQSIAGSISTSVNSLYNFKECYINHSATAQWFLVSATGLSAGVVITAPENFEVSIDLNKFYSGSLTITTGATLASTKVFVRFSPNSTGAKSGNVVISSTGSVDKSISVSGTAVSFTSLSSYYPVTNTGGAALKTLLYTATNNGVKSFSYANLYTHYPSSDTYYDGTVWDVYSTKVDAASPFVFNHGQKKCGNYSTEGDCYNREHTMPQSWFNESSPMVSDIHHILPTDGKVNGMRSNYAFGEVSNPTYTSQQGAKVGSNTTLGYSGTVFEPIDEYKGDIARGLLYMAVRYEDKIGNWSGNGTAGTALSGNSFPAYDQWFIDVLLKWHNQDPPSNREIIRNNYIATSGCQNNRNPFIDSPQYAQKIWGGNMPSEPTTAASNLDISNNTGTSFKLTFKSGDGYRRLIVVRPSSAAAIHPVDFIHYNANSNIASAAVTGAQNYVVYNGTSSSVAVTGLTQGINYTVNVYEYNGWYHTTNYFTTSFASIATAPASVQWGTLTATKQADKSIALNWSTMKETGNALFEVERSLNGGTFMLIHTKTPAGNSTTVQNYSVTDDTLKISTGNDIASLNYRIKQIGVSADFSYSNSALVSNAIVVPDTVIWANMNAALQADSHTVTITWSTLKELNNVQFMVQKNKSGSGFQTVSTVLSKGNSNSTQTYSFNDTSNSGLLQATYRIFQECVNGTSSYSNQQSVSFPPPPLWVPDSVSITGFDATADSTGLINLTWVVNHEGKNGLFDLLRSINNKPFYVIMSLAGHPHLTPLNSTYHDDTLQQNPAISKLVYQLRYTGENPSYLVSTDTQMIVVNRTGLFEPYNYFRGKIYPQPFTNRLNITLPEPDNGKYTFIFTDLLGRQVAAITQQAVQGHILIDHLDQLHTGIYLLKIMHENEVWYNRIIKQ